LCVELDEIDAIDAGLIELIGERIDLDANALLHLDALGRRIAIEDRLVRPKQRRRLLLGREMKIHLAGTFPQRRAQHHATNIRPQRSQRRPFIRLKFNDGEICHRLPSRRNPATGPNVHQRDRNIGKGAHLFRLSVVAGGNDE